MVKRAINVTAFIFCLSMMAIVLLLFGCSKVESATDAVKSEAGSEDKDSKQASGKSDKSDYEISMAQSFHDGLAWVKFGSEEGDKWYGAIDKHGNVKLQFDADNPRLAMMPTAFEDGYSFAVEGDGTVYSINTKGTAVHFGGENEKVLSYGGGMVVTMTNVKDFDSNYFSYFIYKADGTKLRSVDSKNESEVSYRGHGVFWFSDLDPSIYCSRADKWINVDASSFCKGDFEFIDDSDKAYAGISADGQSGVLVTDKGEVSTFSLPAQPVGEGSAVSDNKLVLLVESDEEGAGCTFVVYNLEDGSMKEMPTERASGINFSAYADSAPMFRDDVLILSATGEDGELYIEAFDDDWNRLFEPIQGSMGYDGSRIASEGAIEIKTTEGVITTSDYGIDGLKRFEVQGSLSPLVDGVHLHSAADQVAAGGVVEESSPLTCYRAETAIAALASSADTNPEYLDKEGIALFESLKTEGAKTIKFK